MFIVFRINQGKFTFDVSSPPQERTIQSNTLGLLLEGLRAQDETKQLTQRGAGSQGAGAKYFERYRMKALLLTYHSPPATTRYSTVTLLARLRGLSTSQPRATAM